MTPHPRRDQICSPYHDPPPPHAREIAIKSLINAEPTAIPAKATAGSDNHGG